MSHRIRCALVLAVVTALFAVPAAASAAPAELVVDPGYRMYRPIGSTVSYVEGTVTNLGEDNVTDPRVTMTVDYQMSYMTDLSFDLPVAAHVIAPGATAVYSGPAAFNGLPQFTLVFSAAAATTTAEPLWLWWVDPAGPVADAAGARHWTGSVTNDSGAPVSGLIVSGIEAGSVTHAGMYGVAIDSSKQAAILAADGECGYDLRGLNAAGTVGSFWDGGTPAAEVWGAEAIPWDPMPVWRFYNLRTGSHFFTADPAERTSLQSPAAAVTYRYEGEAYQVNRADPTNSHMLYRFYNRRTGTHFYTVDPVERDNVIGRLGAIYQYDGPAYSVSTHPDYTRPVDRFYNVKTGTHLFSADPVEIQNIRSNLSKTYRWEGTVFYLGY
jgi:hypothetical protein